MVAEANVPATTLRSHLSIENISIYQRPQLSQLCATLFELLLFAEVVAVNDVSGYHRIQYTA